MKTKMLSAMLAAFMLATASVSSITASAAEKVSAGEEPAETTQRLRKQQFPSLRTKTL